MSDATGGKTDHNRSLDEDKPTFSDNDLPTMKRPFEAYPFGGTDSRKTRSPSISGKGFGQALLDWHDMTCDDEE